MEPLEVDHVLERLELLSNLPRLLETSSDETSSGGEEEHREEEMDQPAYNERSIQFKRQLREVEDAILELTVTSHFRK